LTLSRVSERLVEEEQKLVEAKRKAEGVSAEVRREEIVEKYGGLYELENPWEHLEPGSVDFKAVFS
jgi:hypothetical protein